MHLSNGLWHHAQLCTASLLSGDSYTAVAVTSVYRYIYYVGRPVDVEVAGELMEPAGTQATLAV